MSFIDSHKLPSETRKTQKPTEQRGAAPFSMSISCQIIKPEPNDCVKVGRPKVHIPTVNRWVCHTIFVNGVMRRPCEVHANGTLCQCHSLVLTIDSFRASAFALGSPATDQENDPPKGKPAAAVEVDSATASVVPTAAMISDDTTAGRQSSRQRTPRNKGANKIIAHRRFTMSTAMVAAENWDPIGGNELAELAVVAQGTVPNFWAKKLKSGDEPGTYEDYVRSCRTKKIPFLLAAWTGDASADDTYQALEDDIRRRIEAESEDLVHRSFSCSLSLVNSLNNFFCKTALRKRGFFCALAKRLGPVVNTQTEIQGHITIAPNTHKHAGATIAMTAAEITRRKLTVPQLAKVWGVSGAKVLGWIHSGELRAVNLARNPNGRPRFAIDTDYIQKFERSRQVIPIPLQSTQRLRRRAASRVKEFV